MRLHAQYVTCNVVQNKYIIYTKRTRQPALVQQYSYITIWSIKLDPLTSSRLKVREGLADVISMHDMLTNHIPF